MFAGHNNERCRHAHTIRRRFLPQIDPQDRLERQFPDTQATKTRSALMQWLYARSDQTEQCSQTTAPTSL